MKTMIDLFAGIGGFRLIAEKYGYTCVGYSEKNKKAIEYYNKNYTTDKFLGDITKITKNTLGKIDLMTAGVPCQSWSIAGKNGGFNDDRGMLWFHTFRMLDVFCPETFIFENVKGLHDPRNRDALEVIKTEISNRGYSFYIYMLNAANYGSNQTRQRMFIVGSKTPIKKIDFIKKEAKPLNDIVNLIVEPLTGLDKIILTDVRGGPSTVHSWDLIETSVKEKEICKLLLKNRRKSKYGAKDGNPLSMLDLKNLNSSILKKDLDSLITKKILKFNGKYDFVNSKISSGINGVYRIYSPKSKEISTITATVQNDYVSLESFSNLKEAISIIKNNKYRKLTKIELLNIQGFPSKFILPDKEIEYQKLIGNSVPLSLIDLILKNIK